MRLVLGPEFPNMPPKGQCSTPAVLCTPTVSIPTPPFSCHPVAGRPCAEIFPSTLPYLLLAGFFLTKIFHPNVSAAGEICVNVLKKDWSPDLGLRHVFTVIRCLLIEPNPESALNEEAGKLLLEGFGDFAKKARLMTSIHAKK
jgi:ubiquitin-protein ligase